MLNYIRIYLKGNIRLHSCLSSNRHEQQISPNNMADDHTGLGSGKGPRTLPWTCKQHISPNTKVTNYRQTHSLQYQTHVY